MTNDLPDELLLIAYERRAKLLEMAEKRTGKGRSAMGDSPKLFLGTIPTGIPQLDSILGGGWRRGRFGIVTGAESMGKTLITQWTIQAFQAQGLLCGFLDPEKTFDAEWFEKTGVNTAELIVAKPTNTEQAFDIACDWSKEGMDLIIIDSMAALVPKARAESGLEDQEVMGRAPFKLNEGLRQLNNDNDKSVILCTNQLRTKFGVVYGNPDTMPGGRAQRFVASYILKVSRAGWIKESNAKDAPRIGYKLRVETEKNKLAPPFQQCEIPFTFAGHIDVLGGLIDLAFDLGVLVSSAKGGWVDWQGEKYQGMPKLKARFESHPNEVEMLKGLVSPMDLPMDAMPTSAEEEDF